MSRDDNFVQRLKKAVSRKNRVMDDAAIELKKIVRDHNVEDNRKVLVALRTIIVDLENNLDEVK